MPPTLREQLDAVLRDNAFARLVGVELVDWDAGRAVTSLVADADRANIHGSAHGGALFTLADVAFEVACNSYGRTCVGLDVAVHYAAPARAGERVEARAEEASRSRGVASYRVDVSGEDGRTLCVILATAYRTREWHLGEDAWPEEWRASH